MRALAIALAVALAAAPPPALAEDFRLALSGCGNHGALHA